MARYELSILTASGIALTTLKGFRQLTWTRALNAAGTFGVTFTPKQFPETYFGVDNRVEIYRVTKRKRYLCMVGLMQFWEQGSRHVTIEGPDQVDILNTRVIADVAGSANSDKTGAADDLMKAYVDEQMGSGASAARNLSTYLTVDGDQSAGPTVDRSASGDNVLTTLQSLAKSAAQKGTPVYFDVVPSGSRFAFRTYAGMRGTDRSKEIELSEDYGTLADPVISQDYRGEYTSALINTGSAYSTVDDDARIALSPFRRREVVVFSGLNTTTDQFEDTARVRLREGRPIRSFQGNLISTESMEFGLHWELGDRLRARVGNISYIVEVHALSARVNQRGEDISGRLEYIR